MKRRKMTLNAVHALNWVLAVVLVLALVASLVGCGAPTVSSGSVTTTATETADNGETGMTVVYDKDGNVKEIYDDGELIWQTDESETVTEPAPSMETTMPESEPEPELDDPWAMLLVDEAWVKQDGKAGRTYLKRGEKYYGVFNATAPVSSDVYHKYGVGQMASANEAYLFGRDLDGRVLTYGDLPVITLEEGDELIAVGRTTLDLCKAELDSDAALKIAVDFGRYIIYDGEQTIEPSSYATTKFEVTDENGNVMEDYYHLNYGELYTISWFEGTTYHEVQQRATSKIYKLFGNTIRGDFRLEGELHKEGYASFDVSGLEPGLYAPASGSGVIYIP